MPKYPIEPEAFTERVAKQVHKRLGRGVIAVTGPLELTHESRRVDLEDLYRLVRQDPDEAATTVRDFADRLANEHQLRQTPLPFELVVERVLPRICPFDYFKGKRADLMAHQLFVNDTVILYVIDLNGVNVPVTTEQLIRWGASIDDLDSLARANLAAHQPELELTVFHTDDGSAAVLDTGDGYDASRLLLQQIHDKVAPEMGRTFLVAIPTRDVFIAFPTGSCEFMDRVRSRIDNDYRRLPFPITNDLFLMTPDGVAEWQDAA